MSVAPQSPADAESVAVPEGWALTHIGEVCGINPAKPASDALPAGAPVTFVPMPAVDAEEGTISAPQIKAFAEVRKGFTSFRNDDVIMAKITPCMENGKAAIARNLTNGLGFGSTEFHVLRPTMAVLPKYVYSFIRRESYRRAAESEMTGSVGQKRVPEWFLELSEFPLPPLAEQIRIVERLTELLIEVRACDERLRKVRSILKRFRQAVLAAACLGRFTEDWRETHTEVEHARRLLERIQEQRQHESGNKTKNSESPTTESADIMQELPHLPTSWTWCRVEQIANVCLGGTPSRKITRYWGGGNPWVSSGEVANCRIVATEEHITAEGLENSNAKLYPKNTVLLAMIGEGKTRGQSAILDIDACTNQNVAGLVFDTDDIFPDYIWCWALSEYERNRAVGRGGAQPALNAAKVRGLLLPLPPLQEQVEIVHRINGLFAFSGKVEQKVQAAYRRTEKLAQSILAKAFRGELVPIEAELARREGRDYEPASVLLERIRAEKADQAKSPPVSKRKVRKASALVGA